MTKVALLHDWLTGYRGGEKVLLPIASLFPQSPIYTLFHTPGAVPGLEGHQIRTSFLNSMPLATTKYRYYLPLFPLAAETLIDDQFDLIISTSHAVAKSVRTRGAFHWCYIHSPMRYVWDRYDDYFGPNKVGTLPSYLLFKPISKLLQLYDRKTVSRVGKFVANSNFVKQRVKSFYGIDCEVIHPPVEINRFQEIERNPEDYYLYFSALVPYKKADHAILACQKVKRKLKLLGKGPELKKLKSIADPKYIEFIESPSDKIVDECYSKAKALLFPGVEDFGIVPVEASASGLPVIGYKAGGLIDSQTHDTCLFYMEQSADALARAILEFEEKQEHFSTDLLRKNANRFSNLNFKDKIKDSIFNFASTKGLELSL